MIKIIADNKIPFLQGILEPYADVTYLPGVQTGSREIKEADALITRTRTRCSEENLKGSKVQVIATATIGFDHIDTEFCNQNKIVWTNSPGCNSGSVKQYVASVLASFAQNKGLQLKDLTLGIIGVGNVGSKIKDLADGLEMNVLLNDPPREEKEGKQGFVDLDTVLSESDIITIHVPLKREGRFATFHLGNQTFFKRCKSDVIIINSSRGEVIDNIDLLEAINNNVIKGAVLDVWEGEPNINLDLLSSVDIATPHIAGYSVDGKANGTAMSVQSISKYFGFPLNNWYPDSLPEPDQPEIMINGEGKSDEDVCVEAILHTYDILSDDKKLRRNPEKFENQRGSYPVRREFMAYTVKIQNGSDNIVARLNKIGFTNVELI